MLECGVSKDFFILISLIQSDASQLVHVDLISTINICTFLFLMIFSNCLRFCIKQSVECNSLCMSVGVEKNAFNRLFVGSLKYQIIAYFSQITSLRPIKYIMYSRCS